MAQRKRYALLDGKKNVETAQLFCVVDGIYVFKMKDRLAAMILTEPAIFDRNRLWRRGISGIGQKHLP